MKLRLHLTCSVIGLALVSFGIDASTATTQLRKPILPVVRDFAGRPIPQIAHELIDLSLPPQIPGLKPAVLPGWTFKSGAMGAGHEFPGVDPTQKLYANDFHIEMLQKNGQRVGLIRKFFPDRSWQVMDVFHSGKNEWMTERCDSRGHDIPSDHLLVGILHKGDPRQPPMPPRPTEVEQIQYLKDNFGRHAPRSCIGDTQRARVMALINLKTGKLTQYFGRSAVCVSPFFDPCAPDGVAESPNYNDLAGIRK